PWNSFETAHIDCGTALSKEESMMRFRVIAITLALGISTAIAGRAQTSQDSFTPMPLDSGFGPLQFTQPTVPVEHIIEEFTDQEPEFGQALQHYTYRRTARVDTIDDDTKKV